MASAYDTENQIYYIINNLFENNTRTATSYISAIDMKTKEFIFKEERFGRKHQPTYWGVDIGSDGYIHYFSANPYNPKVELLFYYAVMIFNFIFKCIFIFLFRLIIEFGVQRLEKLLKF